MRRLVNKPNVDSPDSDYPYAKARDKTPSEGGTPFTEEVFGDMIQFFERMMELSGITANELPDNNYSGFQLMEALVKAINMNNSAGVIETENQVVIKTKVIEIGDWNMDTNPFVDIPNPVDLEKIRSIDVIIRHDISGGGLTYPLTRIFDNTDPTVQGSVGFMEADIRLYRIDGGFFDSTSFDSTPWNRGWITITYEV